MRNIIKKVKTSTFNVTVYDKVLKKELYIVVTEPGNKFPESCVELSREFVEEKEVTYKMTPKVYFEHATIEE